MTTKESTWCFSSIPLTSHLFVQLKSRHSMNSLQNSTKTVFIFNIITLLDCEVIAASVDSHFSHMEYTHKKKDEGGLGPMKIPLLSDLSRKISTEYGCLNQDGTLTFRATYIIDDKGILKHISMNDTNVGRNPEEILRLVKAFQHSAKTGEVCPAKWDSGAKGMDPDMSSSKTKAYWKDVHAK